MKRFLVLILPMLLIGASVGRAEEPRKTPPVAKAKKKAPKPQTADRVGNRTNPSQQADHVGNRQTQVADRVGNRSGSIYLSGQNGFGGGTYVCRTDHFTVDLNNAIVKTTTIDSAELVDLWEARDRGEAIAYSNEPVDVQTTRAVAKLRRIDTGFADKVQGILDYIKTHKQIINPKEREIPIPPDLNNVHQKPGCPADGMMLFNEETGFLEVDPRYFDKLGDPAAGATKETNEAASYTHEAVYKVLRDSVVNYAGAFDSGIARRLNACLYQKGNCLGYKPLILPTDRPVFFCTAKSTDFYAYKIADETLTALKRRIVWQFSFTRLGSSYFGSETTSTHEVIVDSSSYYVSSSGDSALLGSLHKFGRFYQNLVGGYYPGWVGFSFGKSVDEPNIGITIATMSGKPPVTLVPYNPQGPPEPVECVLTSKSK